MLLMKILKEMAYERNKAIDKFQYYNEKRINHLILAYLYPDNDSFDHWLEEICAWTNTSYRVKPRNKLLNAKTIYDLIWIQPKDGYSETSMKTRLNNFHTSKNLPLITDYDYESLMSYLESFFKWVSNELSKQDEVDNERIKKAIRGFITIYS